MFDAMVSISTAASVYFTHTKEPASSGDLKMYIWQLKFNLSLARYKFIGTGPRFYD